jgi:mycothiol synthase
MPTQLMTGSVVRPAGLEDVEAVCDLCNACSMQLRGVCTHDATEERVDWQLPGFDLETDSRVVISKTGDLIGYASVWDVDEPHVRVGTFFRTHPTRADRAIEEMLFEWVTRRAQQAVPRAPAGARVVLSTSAYGEDQRRTAFLRERGFELVRHFVRLRTSMDERPAAPSLPGGVRIRGFNRDRDLEAAVIAVREMFRDHWGHVEGDPQEELAQWRHWVYEDPDFDPTVWHLAVEGDEIVGVSFGTTKRPESAELAYIYVLGVRKAWRGRGIARALLRHSFREYYERGRPLVDLDADAANLTGAMRLYEGVGMREVWRNDAYEKELRPGRDLSRRTLDA